MAHGLRQRDQRMLVRLLSSVLSLVPVDTDAQISAEMVRDAMREVTRAHPASAAQISLLLKPFTAPPRRKWVVGQGYVD